MNYPGFVLRTLIADGHDPEPLLAGTGLSRAQFQDPNFRTGFDPLRQLFLNAMALTRDPHLGIRMGRRFEPPYIGLPAYAAMNAATLRDALEVLTRFFFLNFPAIDFNFPDPDADLPETETAVRIRPKFPFGDIDYFGIGSALVACAGLFDAVLRATNVVLRADMTMAEPESWAQVATEPGFPIKFRCRENRLILPMDLLDRPLPGSDPINHARLVELCANFAAESGFATTLMSELRRFLEQEGKLSSTLAQAAGALGYSERGLRRELERTGTSFRAIVDELRESRARKLLANSGLSVQQIAYELGYDTPSNFARGFKRWTGQSPSAYRDARKA